METRTRKVSISFDFILPPKFDSKAELSSVRGRTAKAEQKHAAKVITKVIIFWRPQKKTNWMNEECLSS